MGGRGYKKDNKNLGDRWLWLNDVSTERLKGYIQRSGHIGKDKDPQGRDIHSVAFHAKKVLTSRGVS